MNFIEAAFNGVSQAIPLVLNIAANLIAFLAAVNGFLSWFGELLDFLEFSFEIRKLFSIKLISIMDSRVQTSF